MPEYLPRIVDDELSLRLEAFGATLIVGPKWCGKTWTSTMHAKSAFMLADPTDNFANRELAKMDVSKALVGEAPHLIDEWQDEPDLWNLVRAMVDERGGTGHFILTGSAVPKDQKKDDEEPPRHSGTGRFAWIKMRPMSLAESGESNKDISLAALFAGMGDIASSSKVAIPDYAHLICPSCNEEFSYIEEDEGPTDED